jgi:hypothetical protein
MKKLFTLIAFLTCFLGAKAGEVIVDKTVDYSTYNGFPFYVMGYVPEWIDGVMTDFGANYRYATQADLDGDGDAKWKDGETSEATVKTNNGTEYQKVTGAGLYWHQYFIADGIPTEVGGNYTVKALVKASEACTINVNMGNWGDGNTVACDVSIPASDEFVEVEWNYAGIPVTSSFLVAQPGTTTAIIEWKSLTVSHEQEEGVVQTWLQMITDNGNAAAPEGDGKYVGDAEFGAWPAWALELTDGINANWRGNRAGEICAWSLTMGRNFDDQAQAITTDSPRSRPYPSDIEAEAGNESNHVFAVHVDQINQIGDDAASIAWSNQFWIQSPKTWKAGTKIRVKFRYKADHACNVGTQIHTEHPSIYLYWNAFGDVSFTTEWQEFNKTIDFDSNTGGGASLAFNLTSDETNGRTPNVFYFDDLSWEVLKLDEGLFVASTDTRDGAPAYDVNGAKEFVLDPEDEEGKVLYAVVGKQGDESSWVNEVMISTVRGDKSAFNSATVSAKGTVKNADWMGYESKSQAKIKLPVAGVWKIEADTTTAEICFTWIDGEEIIEKELVDVVTNATEVIVKGQEREYTEAEAKAAEIEVPATPGQPWDNQFFLVANRVLNAGEVTIVKFQYKANKEAKTSTQTHGAPGAYIHWAAIGDVNFTEEWQDFTYEYTIPAEADGKDAQSIAFNMAEIKEACNYELKNFQWYLKSDEEGKTTENLIDVEGTKNFFVKEGAGTNPYEFGTDPSGIINVKKDAVKADDAIYNLAGQRVSKDYKGIVVKAGKKTLNF